MSEIFKLFMAKPLNGIVAALCIVVITLHLGLTEVKVAQAVIIEQQDNDKTTAKLVAKMSETLYRVDENVKQLREEVNAITK